MSSAASKSDPEEAYALSDTSSTLHYRSSCDQDDLPHYFTPRQRRSALSQILIALRLQRARPELYDYFSSPREELLDGLLKQPISKESRRSRRTRVGASFVKRLCIGLPLLVLVAFGVLHLLQVLVGQGRLFWDVDSPDHVLPIWGPPGRAGEGLVSSPSDATRDVLPIPCHSHNDYWRRIPLLDAIHWGCTSVEADVWLFDQELYVGHNMQYLARNRTLRNLYINPIVDLLNHMNAKTDLANTTDHGIFDEDPKQPLVLLVDFKSNGRATYDVLDKQLEVLRKKDYLTYWNGEKIVQKPITVVGTGNAPFDKISPRTKRRDIFFDAPLERFWQPAESTSSGLSESKDGTQSGPKTAPIVHSAYKTSSRQGRVGTENIKSLEVFNPSTSYYASASLRSSIGYIWGTHISQRQLEIIRGQIRGAHHRGLKVRYWDTPSWPVGLRNHVWMTLIQEGADVLSVDDLRSAATQNWKLGAHEWWKKKS